MACFMLTVNTEHFITLTNLLGFFKVPLSNSQKIKRQLPKENSLNLGEVCDVIQDVMDLRGDAACHAYQSAQPHRRPLKVRMDL